MRRLIATTAIAALVLAGAAPAAAEARTTAAGTLYELTVVYPPGNSRGVELMVPEARTGPAVVFLHGNGGTPASGVTNLRSSYEAWLDRGWLVYTPLLGARWGNDDSMARLNASAGYVAATYAPTAQVIYGQSMGGLNGLNAIALTDVPVAAWAGNSPATNLAQQYQRSDHRKQINNAYAITASNPYSAATAGHDPNLRPAADFARVPRFRFYASYGDGTVRRDLNTDPFAAKLTTSGLFAEVVVVGCTGGHLSADHYRADDVTAFFEAAIA